jgi:hypothetical protein
MSLTRRAMAGQVRKYENHPKVMLGGTQVRLLSGDELDALQARVDRIMGGERDPAVLLHGARITLTEPVEIVR